MQPRSGDDEAAPEVLAIPACDPLLALQHEFPRYRIWEEAVCDRVRYNARSLEHGLRPHTVITGDLAEMRAALEPSQYAALIPFRSNVPNVARMYDYFLGGKDHMAADRAADLAGVAIKPATVPENQP